MVNAERNPDIFYQVIRLPDKAPGMFQAGKAKQITE
jgi:hypothetical protein